jgi:hypothetical protein
MLAGRSAAPLGRIGQIQIPLYGICLNSVHSGEVWRAASPPRKNYMHTLLPESVLQRLNCNDLCVDMRPFAEGWRSS